MVSISSMILLGECLWLGLRKKPNLAFEHNKGDSNCVMWPMQVNVLRMFPEFHIVYETWQCDHAWQTFVWKWSNLVLCDDALFFTSCINGWDLLIDTQGKSCFGYLVVRFPKVYWVHKWDLGSNLKIVRTRNI